MNHKVAIYIPGPFLVVAGLFADWFGGCSVAKVKGYWKSGGKLVKDDINVVYSFTDRQTLANRRPEVLALAERLCGELGQEAIAVEIDGGMIFQTRKAA